MRVLIVDDKPTKIRAVIAVLLSSGLQRSAVEVAQNQTDARRKLRGTVFDILVLDLAIPANAEDDPSPDGGERLLRDLRQRSSFKVPGFIVGLTEYPELKIEHENAFNDSLWTVLHYSEASNDWENRFRNIIAHLQNVSAVNHGAALHRDICVVTALHKPEFEAVCRLDWEWQKEVYLDESCSYIEGTFHNGDESYSVVASHPSRMGMVSSALLAQKLILTFRPRVLAMCGICAAFSDRAGIGDVLLASPSWDWQSGKYFSGPGGSDFASDPFQQPVDEIVNTSFQSVVKDNEFWMNLRTEWPAELPKTVLGGHIGPVASGASVVTDSKILKTIELQSRKAIGVEMEIFGLYSAAKSFGSRAPITFAVKGVSDFADQKKDDKFRDFAAYTSARCLAKTLSILMPRLV